MADFHAENRYFRILPLGAIGIVGDFEVARVQVGIRHPLDAWARKAVAVRLHTLAGPPLVSNLTQLAEGRIEVPAEVPTQVDIAFTNTLVPMGSTLVVEIFIPGGLDGCDDLVLAMDENGTPESGFLPDPGCDAERVAIDATPDVRLVIAVYGRER